MTNRKQFLVAHTILAAFFLPMGLMYAVTGGLYGLGIKGDYQTTSQELTLDQPLDGELSTMVAVAEAELARQGIETPSGGASLKKGGTSYFLEWTGSRRDIELHPTADPLIAQFKVKETNPHRFFVQLHKAKAGTLFKWFAALWMVGLVGLFVTGGVMAFVAKPYRKAATIAAAAGALAFVALAAIS